MQSKIVASLAALVAAAVALIVALPATAAGNAGTTEVTTFDPTGAVFTCPGTDYTVIGVTLTDGTTSTVYRLAGASWFGGNFNEVNGKFEFSDTEVFTILGPSGGVVAKVAGVEHMGSGGSNVSFTFGACQPPQE